MFTSKRRAVMRKVGRITVYMVGRRLHLTQAGAATYTELPTLSGHQHLYYYRRYVIKILSVV